MQQQQDLKKSLAYIQSELNRIETIAGTLSTVEREHFNKLTNYDHRDLQDIAVEEQSASRQLGEVKHICLALAQKVGEIGEAVTNAQGR